METLIAGDDEDGDETTVVTMDLREVNARVRARTDNTEQPFVVLSDGRQRLELTGGPVGHAGGSIRGAQRIATTVIDYASGMALLELPCPTSHKADLP